MRLLIVFLLWAVASIPLALVVGRAIHGSGARPGVGDEAESYLAGRTRRPPHIPWLATMLGGVVVVTLVVMGSTAALRQLPPARVYEDQTGLAISATTSTTDGRVDAGSNTKPSSTDTTAKRGGKAKAKATTTTAPDEPDSRDQAPTVIAGPARPSGTTAATPPEDGPGEDDKRRPRHAEPEPTTTTTQPRFEYSGPPPSTTTTRPPRERDDERGPDAGTTTTSAPPPSSTTTTTTTTTSAPERRGPGGDGDSDH